MGAYSPKRCLTSQRHHSRRGGGLLLVRELRLSAKRSSASTFSNLVRSNADPSVDMFNVDNPVNLVGYLSREQYGDWPILYGQDFTAQPIDNKGTETYVKSNGKYEKNGRKVEYVYAPEDMHLFPRMWDQSNDQGHADYYAGWMGIGKDQQGNWERAPTVGENLKFATAYQVGWMYMRYEF